jgi:uncharacterized MAPEG superfamily protein
MMTTSTATMAHSMSDATHMLAYSVILTWVMVVAAALIRVRGNIITGVSNRAALPQASALSGRADRAASNMIENLLLFVGAWAATRDVTNSWQVTLGARVFFVARLVYWPIYLGGVPVVRTAIWLTGVAAMGLMLSAVL